MSHSDSPEPPKKSPFPFIFSRIVPAIAVALFLLIGVTVFTMDSPTEPSVQNFRNWQETDAPFGYPIPGSSSTSSSTENDTTSPRQKFDPRLHFHSPWERAAIPRTEQFEAAMGSETWAYTYNAQPFNSLNKKRGGNHSGDDINGIGGQNSDLADPVFAVANGLVVYIGNPSPGWGNCIVLAHRTPDGKILHSMYAHLLSTHVSYMEQIPRGYVIGTVGQADVGYLAHLHLEMRETDGVSPFLSGYPSLTQHDRLNPTQVIQKYMAQGSNIYNPSILDVAQITRIRPELEMDVDSAKNYMEYMLNAPKTEE
ncbi:MAG: M23 family metallopeptidase [Akkermansiaceae bacterium]